MIIAILFSRLAGFLARAAGDAAALGVFVAMVGLWAGIATGGL